MFLKWVFFFSGILHIQRSNNRIFGTFVCQLWFWKCKIKAARMPDSPFQRFLSHCVLGWLHWECEVDDLWDFLPHPPVHQYIVSTTLTALALLDALLTYTNCLYFTLSKPTKSVWTKMYTAVGPRLLYCRYISMSE